MNEDLLRLIVSLHKDENRQGPGTEAATLRAMGAIPALATLPEEGAGPEVLDLGCGTGGQTLVLARNSKARITACDIIPAFVERLEERVKEAGLEDRVTARVCSMAGLAEHGRFPKGSFDVIWSEGAVYHIGVEKALAQWGELLRPGGYLVFSDLVWLTPERPKEVEEFWKQEYPDITTADARKEQIRAAGYALKESFILPDEGWLEYYLPLGAKADSFMREHAGRPLAKDIVVQGYEELCMYLQYKNYYGYVFFIAQKAG